MTMPRDFGPFMSATVGQSRDLRKEVKNDGYTPWKGNQTATGELVLLFTGLTMRLVSGIHGVILQIPLEPRRGERIIMGSECCLQPSSLVAARRKCAAVSSFTTQ